MTIPYDATDRTCTECGEPVEDYTGHSEASEITICETCDDDDVREKWRHRVDIIHSIPRKDTRDLIYDISRYEYRDEDRVSLDFKLNVPKEVNEDLKSSATIEDGLVDNFELRLGLLSKERYDGPRIRYLMNEILADVDLPRTQYQTMREQIEADSDIDSPEFLNEDIENEMTPKINYDPHWGQQGFYQIHLSCHSFFPQLLDEDAFEAFVREFTAEFIDCFEWDTGGDN